MEREREGRRTFTRTAYRRVEWESLMAEEERVLDFGNVPVFYADVIASAEIVGSNVHVVFAALKTIDGILSSVAVVEVVRPLESCLQLTLQDMLRRQMTGAEAGMLMVN